jgi:hypothetical protein
MSACGLRAARCQVRDIGEDIGMSIRTLFAHGRPAVSRSVSHGLRPATTEAAITILEIGHHRRVAAAERDSALQ